jgi:hypothetical protein
MYTPGTFGLIQLLSARYDVHRKGVARDRWLTVDLGCRPKERIVVGVVGQHEGLILVADMSGINISPQNPGIKAQPRRIQHFCSLIVTTSNLD